MSELRGKHILIIVENLPVPFDRRVWQEAIALQEEGYRVSVLSPTGRGYSEPFQTLQGVDIYRYHLPTEGSGAFGYLLEYASALFSWFILSLRIFRKERFHAIHACNPPDLIFLVGIFFKVLFRTRFLFDHHDLNPELYIAKYGKQGPYFALLKLLERLTFATADVVIATNESYRAIAVGRGQVKPEDVFVVRSGPDINRLKILPPDESLKQNKKYLVGYVGVIGKQEGLDLLVSSIEHLLRTRKVEDTRFVVIGDGTELAAIKDLAAKKDVDGWIEFTGRIPDAEMLRYLNTCDVCVNPDVVNEMNDKSTMNKIMEYMALGKPIVQYDMTEGRFSARNASLYARPNDPVDFAEKILLLLHDPALRETMGNFGRERVLNELQWEREKPKLVKAYDRLFSTDRSE